MDSPSPVPPVCRARDGSARQNRLNTCFSSPGCNPMPWSRTVSATASSSAASRTSTGPCSPCSIALPMRLRRIRSTRRGSTSAITGWSGTATSSVTSHRPANTVSRSATCPTSGTRSVGSASSTAKPASNRLISSRSVSRSSNRFSSACNSSALRPTEGGKVDRELKIRSAAMRTVVNGVRSSCDTSEVNRRCSRDISSSRMICRCRFCAIWLKEAASSARSSSPCTSIRWSSSPADSRCAVRAASRTGRTTSRVVSAASTASSSTSATPVAMTVVCTRSASVCSAVSGNR